MARSPAAAHPLAVAALGDSITAGSPLWDPDNAVRQQLGDSQTPASQYEFWAAKRLRGAVRFRNCGVFGERTDQIARRFASCTRGTKAIVVQGGINDIAQGHSTQSAAANLHALVKRAKKAGLITLLAEVLPWNNGYPAAAPAIERLNMEIDAIGRAEHVDVLPFYKALDDPANPGRMPAALTEDGNHPTPDGYRRLGERVAAALKPLLP